MARRRLTGLAAGAGGWETLETTCGSDDLSETADSEAGVRDGGIDEDFCCWLAGTN